MNTPFDPTRPFVIVSKCLNRNKPDTPERFGDLTLRTAPVDLGTQSLENLNTKINMMNRIANSVGINFHYENV